MQFFKRFFLLIVVNLLIVLSISALLSFFRVQPYLTSRGLDYQNLAIFCLIWGFAGSFISLGISRIMAKWMMGVKLVDPANSRGTDANLIQRVHHFARAASLPVMPEVGIYNSPEINAFATGPSRSRSLVAVSSGLLSSMDGAALDGVLAHEVSHIANGDMVTMTLLQGAINAFVMFFARIIGFAFSQTQQGEERRNDNYFQRHMITFVAEIILGFLGMMVVAAFSRWREFRADAQGAKLSSTGSMVRALKALQYNMESRTNPFGGADAQPALAAFKISGKPGGFLSLFSTHPPLSVRIARLEGKRD